MRTSTYWLASVLASAVAVAAIAFLWAQAGRIDPQNFQRVDTWSDLNGFLETRYSEARHAQFKGQDLKIVPTGFFIQSMAFTSAANVNVTGYVWQKYPKDYPYKQGVDFPEEISSSDTVIEEAYRHSVVYNGIERELVGWYFDVTVRQTFDYSRYPLDFLTIWLRVWPADFDNDDDVLFIPDFDSYINTDQAKFGLDQDIVAGEWEIDESFFSYRDVPYDTRFGYDIGGQKMTVPDVYSEFYFNLGAQRKFMNAFIINLVPLFVIALLLFSALMTISRDEDESSRLGFSTTGFLGTCSALFFVVMLSHIQVRSEFAGSNLVYIEYFYLVMYIAILLAAVNSYLFSINALEGVQALHWRDNLLPKILFWPFLLWSMVIVSLVVL